MSKNILLVHASPRSGGNSSILADWFERGALEAGNEVTRVEVRVLLFARWRMRPG